MTTQDPIAIAEAILRALCGLGRRPTLSTPALEPKGSDKTGMAASVQQGTARNPVEHP